MFPLWSPKKVLIGLFIIKLLECRNRAINSLVENNGGNADRFSSYRKSICEQVLAFSNLNFSSTH